MNERIQELAKRTGFTESDLAHGRDEMLWEFAQLIVQECVNVLHDNDLWNRHISHVLNEHFGGEE